MKATPGEIIRFVCRWEYGALYIAVWDRSPGRPAPPPAADPALGDPTDLDFDTNGHRGLQIVDALALEWGYRPDPADPSAGPSYRGKWVWARAAAPPPSEDHSTAGAPRPPAEEE
ncbi:ATP-binding protein [Actinoallomurus rhizosphaericola]|uniref:ATP-binding protein n=1 Tax=Actinoallomurus rhizosphaericola TaxID=2952536 RepID=UPI0020938826|nr:ATP-binding protein [Actinoallomurus rhizosphaericola]MCO5999440.1 ATP-binding protein [Actinoallomurus rhizosphaericola]